MIASIRGTVLSIGLDHVVVEVGGVGLQVHCTPATCATTQLDREVALSTTLVVREDSLTLFGFADPAGRDLFLLVQTVSGVGPRLALAMLAVLEPDAIRRAIATGDVGTLVKIPGIGKKSADRIVLELKDKVGAITATGAPTPAPVTPGSEYDEVVEALTGLGWSSKQATDAVATVTKDEPAGAPVSVVLRAALRELGR